MQETSKHLKEIQRIARNFKEFQGMVRDLKELRWAERRQHASWTSNKYNLWYVKILIGKNQGQNYKWVDRYYFR